QDAAQRPCTPAARRSRWCIGSARRPGTGRRGARCSGHRRRPTAADAVRRRLAAPPRGAGMSHDALAPIVRLAPAKVNLTLSVVDTRPDGFHGLHTVMVPLGLADRLSLARAGGPRDSLHVVGDDGRTTLDPSGFGSVLAGLEAARRAV